jgi:hypothetical protein
VADGHRLIVRGICLDIEDRLWLFYEWAPGLTEPMGEESGIALSNTALVTRLTVDLSTGHVSETSP